MKNLKQLYKAKEIQEIWNDFQNSSIINHPTEGKISPNKYRVMGIGKPCPYCGKKMTHGQSYQTNSKKEALQLGFEYVNKKGERTINKAGAKFFHRHYITLDHKINKARCPEKMFDFDNLQYMCWECNQEKADNNAFDLQHTRNCLNTLVEETLSHYQLL